MATFYTEAVRGVVPLSAVVVMFTVGVCAQTPAALNCPVQATRNHVLYWSGHSNDLLDAESIKERGRLLAHATGHDYVSALFQASGFPKV